MYARDIVTIYRSYNLYARDIVTIYRISELLYNK